MKVLLCVNEPANRYVSALSVDKIKELVGRYDVVVDECSEPDFQEGEDNVWCRVFVTDSIEPQSIEAMLEDVATHRTKGKDGVFRAVRHLPKEGPQRGFEIFANAASIGVVLRSLGASVAEYSGPSGHPMQASFSF